MPTADQIHPHYRRERMAMETDEQYAERMKELDEREAFLKSLAPRKNLDGDTRPQPAQDASKYQELLMAVEKKFPGESRHETALRYIRETELQSCEPKCDAAMAKESGR